MNEGEKVVGLLFPAHEQPPRAVAPAVGAFDDPASRFPAAARPIFAPAAQMELVAKSGGQPAGQRIVVALVEAKPVVPKAGARPREFNSRQCFAEQLVIVEIGSRDDDGERDPGGVGGQAQLGAALASVGRIGPGFFPLPREPWSCSHRY